MLTNSCPQRHLPLLLAKCISNFLLLMFLFSFCTWEQIMKFICLLHSLKGNTEFMKRRAWYEKIFAFQLRKEKREIAEIAACSSWINLHLCEHTLDDHHVSYHSVRIAMKT